MINVDLKPAISDIISVKNLFDSSGWKKFEFKIHDQIKAIDGMVEEIMTRGQVFTEADIPVMNELRATKRTLLLLLNLKQEMLEDIGYKEEKTKKGFEVVKDE